jgi:hypothetical protein
MKRPSVSHNEAVVPPAAETINFKRIKLESVPPYPSPASTPGVEEKKKEAGRS